jgi:hypothetical protein
VSGEARGHGPRVAVALAIVAALVYANALSNGFVLDDRGIILENPLVQAPATSWRAFASPYWPDAVGAGQYRPLGILAFALDHAIAGNSAAWYHAVNVAWFVMVVVLVYRFALGLLAPVGAAVAALAFAVHPVHVEAVANVVGRLELMAAAFGVGALLVHRRRGAAAPALYACALLSKEHAIVVPILAVIADFASAHQAPAGGRPWRLYTAYAVITAAWLALMLYALRDGPVAVTSAVFQDQGAATRLLTVLSVIPHYLRLLVAPFSLSADYEPAVIVPATTLSPMAAIGLALLAAYVAIAVRAWRTHPALGFALLWIPLALAPVANVVVVTGVALAERTMFLASVGASLVAGWLADQVRAPQRALGVASGLLVATAFAWRTWTRTPVWRDPRTFAIALLEERPESYRGHWVAARVLQAAGDTAAAAREFAIALRIYDRDPDLLRESAELARALGRAAEARALSDSAVAIAARRQQGSGTP